jgi:hypothetical protein
MFINRKGNRYMLIRILCLFVIITGLCKPVKADESSEAKTIVNTFITAENSVEKSQLLFSLKKYLPQKPTWIKDLLKKALNDRSPVVVAEAVHLVGEFGFAGFNTDLTKLYGDVEKRFTSHGYIERVQCAIIPALGRIGDSAGKKFLANLLRSDNGSYQGGFLLAAVDELNDPVFVKDIKAYKARLEKLVKEAKAAGIDPFLYSDKTAYIERTAAIEKSLLKGGK